MNKTYHKNLKQIIFIALFLLVYSLIQAEEYILFSNFNITTEKFENSVQVSEEALVDTVVELTTQLVNSKIKDDFKSEIKALKKVITDGKLDLLKHYINQYKLKIDFNLKDEEGLPLIDIAIAHGKVEIFELLAQEFPEALQASTILLGKSSNNSPVRSMLLTLENEYETALKFLKTLKSYGLDPSHQKFNGMSPFAFALTMRNFDAALYLLHLTKADFYAYLKLENVDYSQKGLNTFIQRFLNEGLVKFEPENKDQISNLVTEVKSLLGQFLLFALMANNYPVCEILLEHTANPNYCEPGLTTAAYYYVSHPEEFGNPESKRCENLLGAHDLQIPVMCPITL